MCPLEAGARLQDLQLALLSRKALHPRSSWAWEAWA